MLQIVYKNFVWFAEALEKFLSFRREKKNANSSIANILNLSMPSQHPLLSVNYSGENSCHGRFSSVLSREF